MNKITREEVFKNLEENLKTIRELSNEEEPETNENYRDPLSIDRTVEVKILLSWGGPEDGFKLRFSVGSAGAEDLLGGVYYRADWGEYEEVELSYSEATEVFDFYMGGVLDI